MNNVEEKAIINVKDSYETISIEPNIDEHARKSTQDSSNNQIYLTYPSLPLSSEEFPSNENPSSKIEELYQLIVHKSNQVLDKVEVEKSYKMFFSFFGIGLVLVFISLLMLPMFMITATKFIFTFGTGSIIMLFSFVFLYGLKEYCQMLFEQNRKWLTLSFFLSIFLGLIFAWRKHFFLSLIFAIYQMIAVIMFTLSFIPGGQNGILFIKDILRSPFINIWESAKLKFASTDSQDSK